MFEIAQENKKLSEPLTRALKEVEKLRHELANYQKDKMSLQNAKSRLHVLETQLRDLTWEHEVLEQRFHHVEKERNELFEKFESTIYDVQQKSGFKNILLERKLQVRLHPHTFRAPFLVESVSHFRHRPSTSLSRRKSHNFQRSSTPLISTLICSAPCPRSWMMFSTLRVRSICWGHPICWSPFDLFEVFMWSVDFRIHRWCHQGSSIRISTGHESAQ